MPKAQDIGKRWLFKTEADIYACVEVKTDAEGILTHYAALIFLFNCLSNLFPEFDHEMKTIRFDINDDDPEQALVAAKLWCESTLQDNFNDCMKQLGAKI
jgi:hypothetical protein